MDMDGCHCKISYLRVDRLRGMVNGPGRKDGLKLWQVGKPLFDAGSHLANNTAHCLSIHHLGQSILNRHLKDGKDRFRMQVPFLQDGIPAGIALHCIVVSKLMKTTNSFL